MGCVASRGNHTSEVTVGWSMSKYPVVPREHWGSRGARRRAAGPGPSEATGRRRTRWLIRLALLAVVLFVALPLTLTLPTAVTVAVAVLAVASALGTVGIYLRWPRA